MGFLDFIFGKKDKEPYKGRTLDNQQLYNLSDKESKYLGQSRFLFLGSHRKSDKISYKNVKQAIEDMGYSDKLVYVKNNTEIIKFGVTKTPALVVDGKVVTYGKFLEVEDVKELFNRFDLK